MNTEERTVVLRAQGGDVEAFSALVESYWARLVRFARSVVGGSDAEDVVQDGMVKAWEKLGSLRDPGAFSAWLLRIVSRGCFSHSRKARHLVPLDCLRDPVDPSSAGKIESLDVERILAILPRRQRAVMHLTVVEGMSDTEIAAVLRITPGSVRSHRRRAKDALNRVLHSVQSYEEEKYEIAGG